MPDPNGGTPTEAVDLCAGLRRDLDRGLQFANVVLTVNQEQANEAVIYVQALFDLLVEKGLLEEEEIGTPLERARTDVAKVLIPRVRLGDMGDKYADGQGIDVDCPSLLHLCQSRCCTFKFYLTKQDLDEGVARWDYGNPYWIRQRLDGYCVHCLADGRGCSIYANRPHVCRRFDCRSDKRIWLDFEKRIPAPMQPTIPEAPVAMAEVALQNMARGEQAESEGDPTLD